MKKEPLLANRPPSMNGESNPFRVSGCARAFHLGHLKRQWPAYVLAAALALGAAWGFSSRRGYFPRRESQFLAPQTLERRLDRAAQRLKTNPEDLAALAESGVLKFQKGRDFYPDAVNDLHDAWQLGSLDVRIFYFMGAMYQELALYPQAVEQYQKFLRNRPADNEARFLVAKLLYQTGRKEDIEEAASQYRELLRRLPRSPLAAENLALCLKALKRHDEARASLEALAAFGPDEARRARFYLGQIAFDRGDFRDAMRQYLGVLPLEGRPEIGIEPPAIYAAVAENYDKLNAPAMAKDAWEHVVLLDPRNARAKARLRALTALLNKKKKPARSRRR